MNNVFMTLKSRNKKTGPIPVSTSSRDTCPDSCPLKDGPCYGEGGPLMWHWNKVSKKLTGDSYAAFINTVLNLPLNILWRHNQVGDLEPDQSNKENIDRAALDQLAQADTGKRGFTFTHYDVLENYHNRAAVAAANQSGFTINLSGNNVSHADKLAAINSGPVVTVLPIEYERKSKGKIWLESLQEYKARIAPLPKKTPAGNPLTICPATFLDTSCKDCGLCQKVNRKGIVGFPAHGLRKAAADKIATGLAV